VYRVICFFAALIIPVCAYSEVAEVGNVLDAPAIHESKNTGIQHKNPGNERIRNIHSSRVADSHKSRIKGYRLASGDKIRIHVFGEEGLSMETRLDETGVINYPFLGKIFVKGMTVGGLQETITEGLKQGYLVSPHVNVSIVEHRQFFIKGEVHAPGGYAYVPGLTIRKAISIAGGFSDHADRKRFLVVYDESSVNKVKSVGIDARIGPDDSITVVKSVFFIDGEVNNVGSYPFRSGMTLREAISLAGGLTERASESNIIIISKDGSKRAIGNAGMTTKIHSGDSISIKQSFF